MDTGPGDFAGGMQKDWIVADFEQGNLFCLAIVNTGKGWKLDEWVNMFGLSKQDMVEKVSMGYHTMLLAAANRDAYAYVIARHSFDKKDVDTDYWRGLVSGKQFYGMKQTDSPVNFAEFERAVGRLVPGSRVMFQARNPDVK